MKALILALVLAAGVTMTPTAALSADVDICLNMPSDNVPEDLSDFLYAQKNNETIPDPDWVAPEPPDETEAPQIAKYTDKQWVKEWMLRMLQSEITRGFNAKYRDELSTRDTSHITSN